MEDRRYQTGSFKEFHESRRGWISGQFFPEGGLQHDHRAEVKVVECGEDFSVQKHYHKEGKAWVLVMRGALYFKLDGEEVVVHKGEFVIQEAACLEKITHADPDTQFIAIHAPSLPDNKVVVE